GLRNGGRRQFRLGTEGTYEGFVCEEDVGCQARNLQPVGKCEIGEGQNCLRYDNGRRVASGSGKRNSAEEQRDKNQEHPPKSEPGGNRKVSPRPQPQEVKGVAHGTPNAAAIAQHENG